MCRNWFWIDYFRLNLHLIMEILVHTGWRSEFIIARPLCWEITRNNTVNYFEFCPIFDKDSLHFRKGDASAPPLWRVLIAQILLRYCLECAAFLSVYFLSIITVHIMLVILYSQMVTELTFLSLHTYLYLWPYSNIDWTSHIKVCRTYWLQDVIRNLG